MGVKMKTLYVTSEYVCQCTQQQSSQCGASNVDTQNMCSITRKRERTPNESVCHVSNTARSVYTRTHARNSLYKRTHARTHGDTCGFSACLFARTTNTFLWGWQRANRVVFAHTNSTYLQAHQADVVRVAPGAEDVDRQLLAARVHGPHEGSARHHTKR